MTEADWLTCTDPKAMLDSLRGKIGDRKVRLFAVACCRRVLHRLQSPCFRVAVEICENFADGEATLEGLTEAARFAENAIDDIPNPNCVDPPNEHFAEGESAYFLALCPAYAICLACSIPGVSVPMTKGGFGRGDYLFWVTAQVVWNVAQTSGWAVTQAYHLSRKSDLTLDDEMAAQHSGVVAEQKHLCDLIRDVIGNPFQSVSIDQYRTGHAHALATAIYRHRTFTDLPILADALEEAGCTNADILSHCRAPGPHVRGCWVVDLILGKE